MSGLARLSDNMTAAVFMMLSMAGFALNDAFMKSVSGEVPLFEAIFLRGVVAALLTGILAWRSGALGFRPKRRDAGLVSLRVLGEVAGTICFLTALFHMPLANASAILQSLPLAVTFGAALFLGESVGWRRWLAIGIGFAGVMIIVRPGSQGFNAYSLWALGAVFFIVLRDLSTRRLSRDVPALGVVFVSTLAVAAVAGVLALATEMRTVSWEHLARLATSAMFLLVGTQFAVKTMRIGETGFVQPFRYTLLVWAVLLGIFMFDEWPDAWTLAGGAIVVATGLFTFYRERGLRRAGGGTQPGGN